MQLESLTPNGKACDGDGCIVGSLRLDRAGDLQPEGPAPVTGFAVLHDGRVLRPGATIAARGPGEMLVIDAAAGTERVTVTMGSEWVDANRFGGDQRCIVGLPRSRGRARIEAGADRATSASDRGDRPVQPPDPVLACAVQRRLMDVLDRPIQVPPRTTPLAPPAEVDERAARRSLREQIAKLERDYASAAAAAFPKVELAADSIGHAGPRLLGLGELETTRDDLASRLSTLRERISREADVREEKRLLIERMLLAPGKFKWVRVTNADIGEPGCKSWHVKPRMGVVGMLAGWWHVKISSGCPRRVPA